MITHRRIAYYKTISPGPKFLRLYKGVNTHFMQMLRLCNFQDHRPPWRVLAMRLKSHRWFPCLSVTSISCSDLFRIGVSSFVLLLSSCALFPPSLETPLRLVQVKVLADPALREENASWRETVAGLLGATSDYIENEFGIRLLVKTIAPWPLVERSSNTRVLLSRLQGKVPLTHGGQTYDLIIGLTAEHVDPYNDGHGRVDRIGNCRQGLGNYMVSSVTVPYSDLGQESGLEWDVVVLIHEMGQIFGATHNYDPKSIMNRDLEYRTEFDRRSREIILKNKFCPFGKGVAEEKGPEIEKVLR